MAKNSMKRVFDCIVYRLKQTCMCGVCVLASFEGYMSDPLSERILSPA